MANIYDVASAARVSVATVSAVLNDSAFVSEALRGRVRAAVAALGYQPNLLARSMARQKTQTLGMIVPDIANPFFPRSSAAPRTSPRRRLHAADFEQRNDVPKEEVYLRLLLANASTASS
jgi:DNA-binding LacI/PurR family transcriptional regulator